MAAGLTSTRSQAQTCNQASIAALIDSTSAQLRKLNASHQPQLQAKSRRLAEKNGWSDAEMNSKVAELLQDAETNALDEQVANLLGDLDVLGEDVERDPQSCTSRLAKLKTVSSQLIELTSAKAAHVSARLDAALAEGSAQTAARPPESKSKIEPKSAPPPATRAPEQPARSAPAANPSAQPAPRGESKSWETDTVQHAQPGDVANLSPPPPVLQDLPPRLPQSAEFEYSVEEIRLAGRGFFGSISASLASVIEYAFQNYGRPNGYILGTEGGGAFLAGLRYGKGSLVSKATGEQPVYWQGPSFGYDLGVEGSRVMFLVYNLNEPGELFARFGGVDGSAYLVGGVGITFLKKGRVVLAPIRTGLGLRVGANVGYLKFTPKPSLNPF
ncbi:EipA family protein [Leptospira interrogans]